MRLATIALASVVALTSTAALAASHKRHHHGFMNSMNMSRGTAARTDPNGTAGGPTSLSGTGSSKFGGQIPGSPRAARQ
jgi:hypothetical protein